MVKNKVSENVMARLDTINVTMDKLGDEKRRMHRAILDWIVDYFQETNQTYVGLDNFTQEELDELGLDTALNCMYSMRYDGGNHPEYNSSCWSYIEGIGIGVKGEIYANIEDDGRYYQDRWTLEDGEQAFCWLRDYINTLAD